MKLDHLAIACATLSEGAAWAETRLGVALEHGGSHAHYGTHNRLLGLGDIYLEVIAPDPGAASDGPRWFGLDHAGAPRLATWLCAVEDLDVALGETPFDAGRPVPLARGDLSWRIAVPEDGHLPMEGAWPTLLEWAPGTLHPADRLRDSGCRLQSLTVRHPDAATIATRFGDVDPRVTIEEGPLGLTAVIDTPNGPVTL
ncbi:VOC family protein [Histidinibacterium aquaticum]|uniref:VOC family protein n=1 Tax=Histidinibacterium aquaticum TaxID=2613962 RepID=A0A5J5GNF4_9RHOB|nr:VOC family protein [Histidinibacterium aquaticum]KAA9009916.1 VOC family protein [Histidinibacterium aquaticum]